MLEKLTQQTFETLDHDGFTLLLPDETILALHLVEVKEIPASAASANWGIEKDDLRHKSFSVVWRAAHQPALGQGGYQINHAEIGTLEGLFLVPVAEDQNGRYYEAIFN